MLITSIKDYQDWRESLGNESLAAVLTMGGLHQGHMELVREAKKRASRVVVSIFVNPTQFSPSEDFVKYPRDLDKDIALLSEEGVDAIFAPSEAEIYPDSPCLTSLEVARISSDFCGASRPHFFGGVCLVVAKLFHILRPSVSCFGKKDFQQFKVVERMVKDLHMPIEIIGVETVREFSGLALSSRNNYLSEEMRQGSAPLLYYLLETWKKQIAKEPHKLPEFLADGRNTLKKIFKLDYFKLAHIETLESLETIPEGQASASYILLAAVWLEQVRLIDNIEITIHPPKKTPHLTSNNPSSKI